MLICGRKQQEQQVVSNNCNKVKENRNFTKIKPYNTNDTSDDNQAE